MTEKYQLIAKTLPGLEEVLAGEISEIGGQNIQVLRRAVSFEGNTESIYRSNYQLRTALKILKEITSFTFSSTEEFYRECRGVDWSKYMNSSQGFAIYSTVYHSGVFRNSMFASLKLKDAVADFFRIKSGKRPDVSVENPDIIFHVHINSEKCSIAIDSSGASLHKRGYRVAQGKAPLSEVLAAGMIQIAGWKGQSDLIDPMCGSGTLPIEAALIALNIPPGKYRNEFAFEKWIDFNPQLFKYIKGETVPRQFKNKIYASDISFKNLTDAKANARSAGVHDAMEFQCSDFRKLKLNSERAVIIMNPPYGERLLAEGISELYAMIGERLKHNYSGNTAWILTSSKEYISKVGLKPSRKTDLVNGSLSCKFYEFRLFSGKFREQKQKG